MQHDCQYEGHLKKGEEEEGRVKKSWEEAEKEERKGRREEKIGMWHTGERNNGGGRGVGGGGVMFIEQLDPLRASTRLTTQPAPKGVVLL